MSSPANLKGSLQTMDCYLGPDKCREVYMKRLQPGAECFFHCHDTVQWGTVGNDNCGVFLAFS